jgi:sugar lactone lactonase YvrE
MADPNPRAANGLSKPRKQPDFILRATLFIRGGFVALWLLALGSSSDGSSAYGAESTNAAALPACVEPQLVVTNITFAEGPAFDNQGNLFFVNYTRNGTIGRCTPTGEVSIWLALPDAVKPDGTRRHAFPFGLKVDASQRLLVADYGGRRLLRVSRDKTVQTLADSFEGKPFNNPNDLCLDGAGNVFFTDPQNEDKTSVGAIYRYSARGEVKRVHSGLGYPNGLVVSIDQQRLYVAETWTRRIMAFDIGPAGTLCNQRIVHQFLTPTVDGMCLDQFGRIWVARLNNRTVDVLSPDGDLLASYFGGGDRVTNLAWWERSLYVTVAGQQAIYRLEVGCRGAGENSGS